MERCKLIPSVLFFPLAVVASPAEWIRLGQHANVISHFERRSPASSLEFHMQARALKETGQISQSVAAYLRAAGLGCAATDAGCFSRYKKTVKGTLPVLAVLRAAEQLEPEMQSALLGTLMLTDSSPVAVDAGLALLSGKDRKLAEESALFPVREMRFLLRKGDLLLGVQKEQALRAYLEAALLGSAVRKSVRERLEKHFPAYLTDAELMRPIRRNRMILPLYDELPPQAREALKKAISVRSLHTTASADSLGTDGRFLIETGQSHALPALAEKFRTVIENNPEILLPWVKLAREKKEDTLIGILLDRFASSLHYSSELWRFKLSWIKATRGENAYFAEKVRFLNTFGWNFEWSDELVSELIGDSASIRWAGPHIWKIVQENIKPATSNGRLIYWLHRYLLHTGQNQAASALQLDFWRLAPGSYYARSFWDKSKEVDYARDWQRVIQRDRYLEWISRHGGNARALLHIRSRNLNRYRDPAAAALLGRIKQAPPLPADLLNLYIIGELTLAERTYLHYFNGRVSPAMHHKNRAAIGRRINRLNMSVYYTRQLLRQEMIPEDPFSLPPELLRILYPAPYRNLVDRYTREYGIQPEMVYAIMHQESLFRETAISRSGARGLMQVMPATGKWVAGGLKMENYDLLHPEHSIRIGTKFFADLLRQYDNDFRWSALAYNGGPGNLRKWKRQHYDNDFNLFLERIPVAEPRNYCRITYQNYMHYRVASLLSP
ncbi:MAG: lytic transglycosylase domain-containing protein [Spirochaetales bacterium]|nr:lytic transglycosylase domain-containing protein [Spirochaetales bacterium]